MDLLLYEKEINYLIQNINTTMDHLESVVKLIKNRKVYKNFPENNFNEKLKKASKLNVNKLAIHQEITKINTGLRDIKQTVRNIYHILGQELVSSGNIPSIHFDEYYSIEDIFIRLHLFTQEKENYSYTKIVVFAINILKKLQTIYENILE